MAEFLFLYRRGEPDPASPTQLQKRLEKWEAWFQELIDKGYMKSRGLPLERTGEVVRRTQKKNLSDGPYAEKDLVIGFSLIEAKDQAHASELSTGCPILEEETGSIEVRPIMPISIEVQRIMRM